MSRLILLCVVWMALSAATAYFADIWGRKLGKQRKTLFGWRPKKTAVFIITSAGAIIAMLSFAVLLTADAGIRSALLQWDQTVRQLDAAKTEVQLVQASSKALADDNKALASQVDRTQMQVLKTRQELRVAQAAVQSQEREVQAASRHLADVQTNLKHKQGQLNRTTAELSNAQADLAEAKRNLDRTKVQLVRARTVMKRAESAAFQAGAVAIRESRNAYVAQRIAEQAMLGKLLVRREDELVRRVVPPQKTLAAAKEEIAKALNDARTEVQRRSADRGVSYPAGRKYVQIARKVIRSSVNGKVEDYRVPEQQIIDAVAGQLMAPNSPQPGGVVLQVVAVTNTMAGETVPVDFRLFENHVVFTKGAEITRVVIERGASKEGIVRSITGALQQVRTISDRNGLMPDRDNSVTAVPLSQIADVYMLVMDRLTKFDQPRVPVRVVAAHDAWTAGPLELRLEVLAYDEKKS